MRRIIVSILFLSVLAGSLSVSGFCFGEHRFLSDQEFIDAAVQELMKGRGTYSLLHAGGSNTAVSGVPYVSKEEFISDNPDCCSIASINYPRDSGPQFTILDRVLGRAAKLVKVKYKERWTEDGEPKVQVVDGYLGLTNCGEVNHARDYWWK
ncbi:hypothetical protein UP10_34535 [Bradyrhizobium sp. LTSPM299]|uniref:hypothetical protein n=1 Tax=Bradyrhizobium sp. LTSPM299 TaxID=1619233 RepID=UPI0005CA0D76|nr:hypothetical protein [Bradyrhizobium sp. LTSPM299]KJC56402.1 hypothetical protein UP10_34535 [Bradyrhizobium sp. LTSPM299]